MKVIKLKESLLHSGKDIKTLNGEDLLGEGNIAVNPKTLGNVFVIEAEKSSGTSYTTETTLTEALAALAAGKVLLLVDSDGVYAPFSGGSSTELYFTYSYTDGNSLVAATMVLDSTGLTYAEIELS